MNVAFLSRLSSDNDAVRHWVLQLGRHCKRHSVKWAPTVKEAASEDIIFVMATSDCSPRGMTDHTLAVLKHNDIKHAFVHNETKPAVPSPGDYPSFAWTRTAMRELVAYNPVLCRQPVFAPVVPARADVPWHLGTFGRIEPKKQTLSIAVWAQLNGIPFTAYVPEEMVGTYDWYVSQVDRVGGMVVKYNWAPYVEDLAPMMKDVSHFLFMLVPTKEGSGGSSTSARCASLFGRPVIVADDEPTFEEDNYLVLPPGLGTFSTEDLGKARLPDCSRGSDEYLDELIEHALAYWSNK